MHGALQLIAAQMLCEGTALRPPCREKEAQVASRVCVLRAAVAGVISSESRWGASEPRDAALPQNKC